MFCNFLSPTRTSIPYDQSTNAANNNSYVNESFNLQCSFYIKNENTPINQLSENCTLYMKIINEKTHEYSLNIKNNKISPFDSIQFVIDKECKIFRFTHNLKNKCLMLYNNSNIYILELLQTEKEEAFLEKLEILQISSNLKISISESIKEKQKGVKYIINYGDIKEINIFIDNLFKNDITQQQQIGDIDMYSPVKNNCYLLNSNYDKLLNNFINKNEFMKNFPIYKEIYICKGKAFRYNKYTENVVPIEDDINDENEFDFLKINKIGYNIYILLIEQNNKIYAFTKIEENAEITISEEYGTMSFISQNFNSKGENCAYTFSFKDQSINEINFLKNLLIRCIYEKNNYMEDLPENQIVSVFDSNDIDMDYDSIEYNFSFLSTKSKIIDIGQYSIIKNINENENIKNKTILQTYNNHRTFVIKDNNQIDIFKTTNDNNGILINISSLNPIKVEKNFSILNAKMFNNDNEILFQDSKFKNKLYQYDLTNEHIIQDWDCDTNKCVFSNNNNDNNNKMIDFTYPKKLGQLNSQNEMIGINSNNIFLLDGRVNRKNKIVNIKPYYIDTNFTCIVTTGSGGIATGSENGDIRLFNEIGNNAKTLITGFDSPIRYIDCSVDGKYILATCDKYIMVINTVIEDNYNGFNKCLGRIKVKPLILKLSKYDLNIYNIDNKLFTPAKFNNITNSKEIMIISSLGQYLILWNFDQVQNGQTDLYRIINVNEIVIDNTTKFDENQLIVALSDKLRFQNEKLLKD